MSRIWTLMQFAVRDLCLSLSGIAPLAAALAFGLLAFEYGMDQPQFITVGGVGIGAICLLTVLLLASRVDRASSYLLVARLRRRRELLAALLLGGLAITCLVAILIAAGNLLAHRLSLTWPEFLWIVPTWLALWLFLGSLGLALSSLVSQGISNIVGYALVVAILVLNEQRSRLLSGRLAILGQIVEKVTWPVGAFLSRASAGSHDRIYWLAGGLVLLYAAILFGLATALFEDKDLLWTE